MPTALPSAVSTRATAASVKIVDAALERFARHRLRDRAHAAERVSPLPALAVDLAEDVMQQHVRRARRVRAREIADDRVEAERRLDRLGLEPAVEHVAGALGEQVEHVAPLAPSAARFSVPPTFHAWNSSCTPPPTLGGVSQQQRAQHIGDALEHRVVRRQRGRILAREARDLGLRRRAVDVRRRP